MKWENKKKIGIYTDNDICLFTSIPYSYEVWQRLFCPILWIEFGEKLIECHRDYKMADARTHDVVVAL
jgi:hypothetical protein